MEKHSDDAFTFYFIGIIILLMAALMAGTMLGAKPLNLANLLVPSVFGGTGLIFLVGTHLWERRIGKDFN
jgi:hypothetical protein